MRSFPVLDVSQVAEARRGAVALAQEIGFDEAEAGRVAIVATELATNLIKHAAGGEILVGTFDDPTGAGLECIALDKGPGIADVEGCFRDGYSTAGSAGTGLGAVLRQSQSCEVYSRPDSGTALLARLRRGRLPPAHTEAIPAWGAVEIARSGETACGDAWCVSPEPSGPMLMVADGLGHGPIAAAASREAVRTFLANHDRAPAEILEAMHGAMRSTRGAAVAIADIDASRGEVRYAGVGNIAGTLLCGSETRKMVSHNGTIGHTVKRIQEFGYAFGGVPLVILHSDGLGSSWSLDRYPGLATRHPTLIASVLYRDYNRGRDDVTVLVCRWDRPT